MRKYEALTEERVAALSLAELKRELKARAVLGSGQIATLSLLNAEIAAREFGAGIPRELAADLRWAMTTLAAVKKAKGLNSGLGRTRMGLRRNPIDFMRMVTDRPGPNADLNRTLLIESGNAHLTFEALRAKHAHLFN